MEKIATDICPFEELRRGGYVYVDKTDLLWRLVSEVAVAGRYVPPHVPPYVPRGVVRGSRNPQIRRRMMSKV